MEHAGNDWIGQLDAKLAYYLHVPDASQLTDQEWCQKVAMLHAITQRDQANDE